MSAQRWCLLFLMLAGACVTVESPAQFREAAADDIHDSHDSAESTYSGSYAGPGSFSDAFNQPRQQTRESPEGAYPQNALKISATSSPMVIRLRLSSST
jgi:hypothetical protein